MKPEYERRRKQIAEFMEKANAESVARAAAAGPVANIEQALRLSALVRRSDTNFVKPPPPSLAAIYRARRAAR